MPGDVGHRDGQPALIPGVILEKVAAHMRRWAAASSNIESGDSGITGWHQTHLHLASRFQFSLEHLVMLLNDFLRILETSVSLCDIAVGLS